MIPQTLKKLFLPPVFGDEHKDRSARILNSLLLLLGGVSILFSLFLIFSSPTLEAATIQSVGISWVMAFTCMTLQYWLRRGHIRTSSMAVSLILFVIIVYTAVISGGLRSVASPAFLLVITITGILLGGRFAVLAAYTAIVAASVVYYLENFTDVVDRLTPVPFIKSTIFDLIALDFVILLVGLLLRVALRALNNAIERFRESNAALETLRASLEERVRLRTRDLSVAVEVGHVVSQVRELNTLLTESVELIRTRFDLYYVQVYLLDVSGRSLLMQAGSGLVGRQLAERGHRLPVGTGSINGMAIAERRPIAVSSTVDNPLFRPNALLPYTRSEMSIPMVVGGQALGVLNLQSDQNGALSEENLPVFEALAGQLAVAIDNANLFTQISEAQKDLAEQARRLTRSNWQEYLNAIDRQEQLDYTYSLPGTQSASNDVTETLQNRMFVAPIEVVGEPVGLVQIEQGPKAEWSSDKAELVRIVAAQVAQQVENIRLLEEAEKYRAEAEAATRRLMREAWDNYREASEKGTLDFVYDQNVISAGAGGAEEEAVSKAFTLNEKLTVQGESIGYLELLDIDFADNDVARLATAVAEQLSAHLENLRLNQQTEARAAELEILNKMSAALAAEVEVDSVVGTIYQYTLRLMDATNFYMALYDSERDKVEFVLVIRGDEMIWHAGQPEDEIEITKYLIRSHEPLLISADVADHFAQLDITQVGLQAQSWLGVPMLVANKVTGVIVLQNYTTPHAYNEQHLRLLTSIASQAAIALESTHLFEQVQNRARQEQILRQITDRIYAAPDAESILKTTAKEVNRVLGLETFVYLDSPADTTIKNGN